MYIHIYMCVCVCVCVCIYISIKRGREKFVSMYESKHVCVRIVMYLRAFVGVYKLKSKILSLKISKG